ncbi:MAG: HNH endonuclease [Candidatus Hodarchaeales archaeon]
MIKPGDIISYLEMCAEEGVNLQRGMNYHLRGDISVVLMSLRPNAPYADRIEDNGSILIYEGHDIPKTSDSPIPKVIDQPMYNPGGSLTQNGLFYQAATRYKKDTMKAELVRVYEKLHKGIWVYNGIFSLLDAWQEESNARKVFKFKLEISEGQLNSNQHNLKEATLDHDRLIPPAVKLAVWKRDRGKCVLCGSTDNLHFDHIIPYSKGGSSLVAENIQLLCARHNIAKRDKIE